MSSLLLPQPQRELHPIPTLEEPWTHSGIDLVCDLHINSKGIRHILVVVCYLADGTLKNKTTREMLDKPQVTYLPYGVPKVIHNAKGPELRTR